mmetsp:Transcript_20856/g.51392  ORF Transcript_20856/g.51392 Transcript_20856/m.51392 type:complete len:96 (-) Transcript_20856:462-749(-)
MSRVYFESRREAPFLRAVRAGLGPESKLEASRDLKIQVRALCGSMSSESILCPLSNASRSQLFGGQFVCSEVRTAGLSRHCRQEFLLVVRQEQGG